MNQQLNPLTQEQSLCQSPVLLERITSKHMRAVLCGDVDRVEAALPHSVDPRRLRNRASTLLRQVKDRLAREARLAAKPCPSSLERERATRVYLDPDRPHVLVCDTSAHDSRKDRAYAPVLRLAVGESCFISPATGHPRSIHLRLCAIAKHVREELGFRPAFHARVASCGVYQITRLKDGTNPRFDPFNYAQVEDDPRLEQLVQQELAEQ